jgi:hypothetical protein
MRQAGNWLIVGASGTGKTFFLQSLVPEYKRRVPLGVVINSTKQLSQFCDHKEYVSLERQKQRYAPDKLAALIRRHGWVHFEVAPMEGKDKLAFLESLYEAVFSLGVEETDHCEIVVIVDEARLYLTKRQMPFWAKRCEAEGRKFGIDLVKADQRYGSADADVVDHSAVVQITRLLVFGASEGNQRKRLMTMIPTMPDPITFERPVTTKGWGGDYVVSDYVRGASVMVKRDRNSPKRRVIALGDRKSSNLDGKP